MFLTEPSLFMMRGRALECLGHIAVAIGCESFAPYFELGMQGISLRDEGLQEYSYIFVANCAKVVGERLNAYLPTIIPHLLEVVGESELSYLVAEDDEEDEAEDTHRMHAHSGDVDLEDEDDDDDDDGQYKLNVHEGFINTKKSALTAIGSLAEHTGSSMMPYIVDCLQAVLKIPSGAAHSLHKLIRAEGLSILPDLLNVLCCAYGPTASPGKGEVVSLHATVAESCLSSLEAIVTVLDEDEEKLPVSMALEGAGGIVKRVGIAALTVHTSDGKVIGDKLMSSILNLLLEKGACQSILSRDADEEDDNGHDNVVMDSVCDLIGTFAKQIGSAFVPYFEGLRTPLLKFTKPSRAYSDRAMAIGCFAEVVNEIDAAAATYVDILLPILQGGLADEAESVRRNSAFCVGALCSSCGAALLHLYPQLLQWLHPLCLRSSAQTGTDTGGGDTDNALSAACRMISTSPSSVPLQHVLPVILDALPLRADMLESPYIYGCLAKLVESLEPVATSLMPRILVAFAQAIHKDSKVLDEAKALVTSCLKAMVVSQNHQTLFTAAFQHIEDLNVRTILEQAIQAS
jgi:hypothetical protein